MGISDWIKTIFIMVFCMFVFSPKPKEKPHISTNAEIEETAKFIEFLFVKDYKKYTHRNMKPSIKIIVVKNIPIEGSYKGVKDFIYAGYCFVSENTILISSQSWGDRDYLEHVQLIYHELGHCALNRSHIETLSYWIPASMMYPVTMHSRTYGPWKQLYDAELFRNQFIYDDGNLNNIPDGDLDRCYLNAI